MLLSTAGGIALIGDGLHPTLNDKNRSATPSDRIAWCEALLSVQAIFRCDVKAFDQRCLQEAHPGRSQTQGDPEENPIDGA